jgi:predicted phage tail protein
VIPPGNQSPPANIVISSFSVVQQNISVETMRVSWDQAQNAIAYEAVAPQRRELGEHAAQLHHVI